MEDCKKDMDYVPLFLQKSETFFYIHIMQKYPRNFMTVRNLFTAAAEKAASVMKILPSISRQGMWFISVLTWHITFTKLSLTPVAVNSYT